tara:strand:- start:684 stop:1082 length:399 start_codon:yes stop_codon:yes gene_type:complete
MTCGELKALIDKENIMTEDVMDAVIGKLKALALEQYAMIKDRYHSPMDEKTVSTMANAALNLAQIEGAIVTLQEYSDKLAMRTHAELAADPSTDDNITEVEVEEDKDDSSHDALMARSPTYRKSMKGRSGES